MASGKASQTTLTDLFRHARDHHEMMAPLRELVGAAVKLNPRDFSLVKMMGEILFYEDRHEEALPWLRQAAKRSPRDSDLNAEMGISLYATKQYAEAAPYLQKTLTRYPNDQDQRMMLGYALYKSGHGDQAAKHLKAALKAGIDIRDYAEEITELALAGLSRKQSGRHPSP
jgi:Flp pilus assembly protein TadD